MAKRNGGRFLLSCCVYCGFPTRHWSQTCPVHRDLVALDAERLYNDAMFESDYGRVAAPAREREA